MVVPRPMSLLTTMLATVTLSTTVLAGTAPASGCHGPVHPAPVMRVDRCDTPERIVAKAAHIVPRGAQLAWQRQEVTAFTHFGMNTFTNREWGSGAEDRALFNPQRVDTKQWMDAYRASGAKQAMVTVKHHDGFTLYPSRYTPHSVRNSPWWQKAGHAPGRGDILRSYVDSARAHHLKVGVYLSPADGAELPHAWHAEWLKKIRAKQQAGKPLTEVERTALHDGGPPDGLGRYGNGSKVRERIIPTLVPGDDRADEVASGELPTFHVRADDYNAYYLNQLYELFTQYGPINEFWLDGANPWENAGLTERYDFTTWFRLIKALSPRTVVFGGPQGLRWVGNEDGVARTSEWSVTPATAAPRSNHGELLLPGGPEAGDIGSRRRITTPRVRYLQWFPAEADVSLRPGWFYHRGQRPKSAGELLDLYEKSVGRNSLLLLNTPPARDGRIAPADFAQLRNFGAALRRTYDNAVAGGVFNHPWSPPGGATTGSITLDVADRTAFDRIRLGEDIRRGQRVESFLVWARVGSRWREIGAGTTIGSSRILPLDRPVIADEVRVTIRQARATPYLREIGLHRSTLPS